MATAVMVVVVALTMIERVTVVADVIATATEIATATAMPDVSGHRAMVDRLGPGRVEETMLKMAMVAEAALAVAGLAAAVALVVAATALAAGTPEPTLMIAYA